MQHVLPPKMGAMHVCLEQLRGHATVIYDVTIAFSNTMTGSGQRIESPGMPGMIYISKLIVNIFIELFLVDLIKNVLAFSVILNLGFCFIKRNKFCIVNCALIIF